MRIGSKSGTGLDEKIFRKFRHGHAAGGKIKTTSVVLRSEKTDLTLWVAVGLKAFKNFLSVMKNFGARVELKRAVRNKSDFAPSAFFVVTRHHNRRHIFSKPQINVVNCKFFYDLDSFWVDFNSFHREPHSIIRGILPLLGALLA